MVLQEGFCKMYTHTKNAGSFDDWSHGSMEHGCLGCYFFSMDDKENGEDVYCGVTHATSGTSVGFPYNIKIKKSDTYPV